MPPVGAASGEKTRAGNLPTGCLRRAAYHPFIEYTQHADISGHPGIKQQQTF